MTEDQAGRVLALMARPFNVSVDPSLLESWYQSALERVDYDTGLAVARSLIESSEWMPRPAQFNAAMRQRRSPERQALTPVSTLGALEAAAVNSEVGQAWIGEIRRTMAGEVAHSSGPCAECARQQERVDGPS